MSESLEKCWPDRHSTTVAAFALAVGGLALIILSAADFFPLIWLGRHLSSRGALSDAFTLQLRHSQWIFAALLMLVSPFIALLSPVLRTLYERSLARGPWMYGFLAAASVFLSLAVQCFLFQNIPHITDATAHLFQAKIFALGRLFAPAPICYEHFFQYDINVSTDGRWFSLYPPGCALYLSPFILAHCAGLALPFSFGITTLACIWIVKHVYGSRESLLLGCLMTLSPLNLLLASSFMSHTVFLMFYSAAAALGIASFTGEGRTWVSAVQTFAAGLLGGMAAITRPQDFAALTPALLGGLWFARRALVIRPRAGIAALLGFGIPMVFLLGWNISVYGHALDIGYGRANLPMLTHTLAPHFGLNGAFGWHKASRQFLWTLSRFDRVLLGWPTSLALAPLFILSRRRGWFDGIALMAITSVIALYFFYAYYGLELEARFYAPAVPFAVFLVVRGVTALPDRLQCRFGLSSDAVVAGLLAALTLHALVFYWPSYLWPTFSRDYEQASPVVRNVAEREEPGKALILIDTSGANTFRYSSGFMWNDPLLTNEVIYARDLGDEKNECLKSAFHDRTIYRFMPNADWSDGHLVPVWHPGSSVPP